MAASTDHARIIALESLVTHLQRDLDALNAVLLEQQRQLDGMKLLLARMDERLAQVLEPNEPFDPRVEKPPHY